MAELLSEDSTLNTQQRLYLSTMRSNGDTLIELINNILDVAKIEAGRLSLESLGFELEELVDKTLETMRIGPTPKASNSPPASCPRCRATSSAIH